MDASHYFLCLINLDRESIIYFDKQNFTEQIIHKMQFSQISFQIRNFSLIINAFRGEDRNFLCALEHDEQYFSLYCYENFDRIFCVMLNEQKMKLFDMAFSLQILKSILCILHFFDAFD